ncbi:acyltransferase [Mesorhizobium sp.]|uniref:acyltransferase family protein n=1 Tax=Mesorhizobium sp. TaxID=1871066 RepID=UPI000FE6D2D5|nr:acyltransferase [Mesorhizobium sp.]RWC62578.1 MAG: acyltransferase [Mesorhizobium sp.]RWC63598.1 MAG: acyltransferase [Mesorhizobium sp.]
MRIDSLTSLRFFAALGVLLHHLDFLGRSTNPSIKSFHTLLFEGFNGVTFFFILSGFIISLSFTERARSGEVSFSDFIFFRVARLYPTHLLTLFAAIVAYRSWPYLASDYRLISNIFLVQATIPDFDYYFSFNGVSWSISAEMIFYSIFCLVAFSSSRQLVAFWLVLMFLILINILAFGANGATGGWLIYINPAFRFIDFLTGMLLYRLFKSNKLRLAPTSATILEVASMAFLGAATLVAVYGGVGFPYRLDIYYILPMSAVIFIFAHQRGFVSRVLAWWPLVLLGDSSFALYMIHQIIVMVGARTMIVEPVNSPVYAAITSSVILVTCVLVSVIIYKFFERPLNIALRRVWSNYRARVSEQPISVDNSDRKTTSTVAL